MIDHLKFAQRLAVLLDGQFRLGKFGFGLDAFIDLFPVGGDILILGLSLYIVWVAYRAKVPKPVVMQMLANVGIASAIGLVPVLGDAAYIFLRPNMHNIELLKRFV